MLFEWLKALLFPPKCVLCGKLLEREETDLCHECRTDRPLYPRPSGGKEFIDRWTAVWYYDTVVRRSLLRYKFHGARHYASCYGRMLAMKLTEEDLTDFDLLTWIPVSAKRLRKRGYDQAQLLAQAVGAELGREPTPTLRKKWDNPPQSGISGPAQRRANVLGIYQVLDPERVRGKNILLLDDILTTSATASECARMLLTAGAERVTLGAVAAGGRKKDNG